MSRSFAVFTAIILLLLYLCPIALAADLSTAPPPTIVQHKRTLKIYGTIFDETRAPLRGITVKIGQATAKTNAHGKYSLKIKSGAYLVQVSRAKTVLDFDTMTFVNNTQLNLGIQISLFSVK